MEFQTDFDKEDSERIMGYDLSLYKQENSAIITVIIYSGNVTEADPHLYVPENLVSYFPNKLMLADYYDPKSLPKLEKKVKNSEDITSQEMLYIAWLPIINRDIIRLDYAIRLLRLTKTITDTEKRKVCVGAIIAFAERYLSEEDFKVLEGEFRMTNVFIQLEDEIEQRGMQKGIQKRNLEIANEMLLMKMNISDIIKITGLDEATISNLAL